MGYSAADSTRQKFTRKERDSESGLDYFLARYYSSAQGRFTSPDPLDYWALPEKKRDLFLANPQRWNRYVFVLNNPLRFVDPDGLADVVAWDKLSKEVQEDLLKHKVTKEKWDSWSSDQRQRLVNFRARMIGAGVWSAVDKVGFVRWRSDGKTTVVIEEKDPRRNFELAFTTKPDINVDDFRGRLSNAGITNDFFVHSEAAWSNHEGGLGISIHVLGFKAPSDRILESHFDAGGGNWWNPAHWPDSYRGTGPSPDDVTRSLAHNATAVGALRGFGTEVDKLVAQESKK